MAQLRIALVNEASFPDLDGTTSTLKPVADRMIDLGHDIRFIVPGPGLGTYRGARIVRTSPLAKTGTQVRDALGAFRPDVVVCLDPDRLGRKALTRAGRRGVPTVVLQQRAVADVEAYAAKIAGRADRVLTTSHWLAARFHDAGVGARVWEPGVDTDAFSPALRDPWLHRTWSKAKSRSTPLVVVGYAGALAKRHGVRRLAALNEVAGIRPVIIGDGAQRGWLENRLPHAKITGALGTGDLSVALASCDIVVHPGEEEGCGHVLREAGASGVPVVAPRAGVAPELVDHLGTGVLYSPGERDSLAEAVRAVAADPRRALLGEQGRVRMTERTWTDAADDLVGQLLRWARRHRVATF